MTTMRGLYRCKGRQKEVIRILRGLGCTGLKGRLQDIEVIRVDEVGKMTFAREEFYLTSSWFSDYKFKELFILYYEAT